MACAIDRTKSDMRKKGIIDNSNTLKDKSATGVNRLHEYALNLKNLAYKKFGDFGLKPFIEPFTNKVEFNEAFFNTVDKFNEEKDKEQVEKAVIEKSLIPKEDSDEEKSEKLRLEQEAREELIESTFEENSYFKEGAIPQSVKKDRTTEVLDKIKEIQTVLGINLKKAIFTDDTAAQADIVNRLILYSEGNLSDDNFTEEILHFVLDIVEAKNKELFNELLNKIRNYKIYTETLSKYKNDKDYRNVDGSLNTYKIKKEAITKLLVEKLLRPTEHQYDGLFVKLWAKISNFIKKLFNSLPNNLKDEFSDLAEDILITKFEAEDAKLLGKESYKSKTTYNIFKSNREQRAYFEDDRKNITQGEEPDEDGEMQTFYYKEGKKKERVTSLIKEATNQFYSDIDKSEQAEILREAKKQKGTDVHKTIEDIVRRYVNTDTGELRDAPLQAGDKLIPVELYKKLEENVVKRLKSYPKGTLFSIELPIVHGENDYAGTLDFVAFLPDMQVDILDWKTMDMYYYLGAERTEREDVSPFNQQYWRSQLMLYKNLLISHGIKNSQFRYTRAIPIGTKLERVKQGFTEEGQATQLYEVTQLKIGDTDISKIKPEEFYLTPVSVRDESTGSKELDELISKMWGIYDRLSKTPYTKDLLWKKKKEMDGVLSAIRELQVKKKSSLLTTLFNDAFKRFDKINEEKLEFLDEVVKNQRFLKPEEDKALNLFLKDAYSAIEFLNTFSNIDKLISELYPKEERSELDKVIVDKLLKVEANSSVIRDKIVDKVTEVMDKTAIIYNIDKVSKNDFTQFGVGNMLRHFMQRDEKTLQFAARLLNTIRYTTLEEEKKLFNDTDGKFKTIQEGFFKWVSDNNSSFKKAFNLLLQKENRLLISKIKKEYFEELKSSVKDRKTPTVRKKAEEKYEEIVKKYTSQGYKAKELDEKVKAEYKKYITPWLKENYNLENFDKVFNEGFERYKEGMKGVTADENPMLDKIKKDKWQRKWLEEHDVYQNPKALDVRNPYLSKEGVLNEEKWFTEEYKFLLKPENKELLDAYNLFLSLNERANSNGMLTDVYASKLFIPSIKDNSLISGIKRSLLAAWYFKKTFMSLVTTNDKGETVLDPLTKKEIKKRPVYYKRSDDKFLSEDLFEIYEKWAKHIINYEAIMAFEDRLNILFFLEKEKPYQNQYKKEGVIKNWKKRLFGAFGYSKEPENEGVLKEVAKSGNVEGSLENYISHYLYSAPIEERPAFRKLTDAIINYTNQLFIGFNLILASGAYTSSLFSQRWSAGKFTKTDALIGNLLQWRLISAPISKIIGWDGLKKTDFLLDYFNAVIDNNQEFEAKYKTSLSKKVIGRHVSLSKLGFKPLKWVDETLQESTAIAFFLNSTIIDGEIVNISDYVKSKYPDKYNLPYSEQKEIKAKIDKEVSELKKNKNLYTFTKEKGGNYYLEGISKETNKGKSQTLQLQNKIQRYNIDILGVADKWDRPELSLYWATHILSQFKNFMYGIFGSRFAKFRWNDQKQEYAWGRHSVYLNHLVNNGIKGASKTLLKHFLEFLPYMNTDGVVNFQSAAKDAYEEKKLEFFKNELEFNITEQEFADMYLNNMKNEISHLNTMILVTILPLLIYSASGDDDKEWYWRLLLRYIFKVDNEVSADISLSSWNLLLTRGVVPSMGALNELWKFIKDSALQGYGFVVQDEDILKKAKPLHRGLKATPYLRQIHTMGTVISEDYADIYDVEQPPDPRYR